MSLREELEFAVELARGAGKIVLDHFGRVERLYKRHAEAVSEADRASQRFIVAGLKQRFPTDGIVGEENETGDAITFDCPDPMGRVWVIDPIDGTNNFLAGLPEFAVCIGMLDRGEAVLGVVLDVCRDQVYRAARGHSAWLDDRRTCVVQTPLDEGALMMFTANLLTNDKRLPRWASRYMEQTAYKVRVLGSAALEAAQVASGVAHSAITVNGKLWDIAAPAAIVIEAGGRVTDPAGRDIFPFDLRNYDGGKVPFVAAAPQAHSAILREIALNP